ncbi:phosphopyruvate hydratase [Nonomuraea sp. H19]|uniref:phosphopyruvate hydratase n=1 Tax=Nonomuraea sp. H19 TaxID=3452206 RepID=UPI003F8ADA4E
MSKFAIINMSAVEILDSRGRPTLSVHLTLANGATGWAGVPSGASTGSREAVELRDGDSGRYGGAGVLRAVGSINGEIALMLEHCTWISLAEVDQAMIELDGTRDKSRLGANALVGVSMALTRALAHWEGGSLYEYLTAFTPHDVHPRLPVPHFNVLNGGVHADNAMDFQEFMIAPLGAASMSEAVRIGAEVYAALHRRLAKEGRVTSLGDEGGFAPQLADPEDALALLVAAIEDAGHTPGLHGVAIALDPAASRFREPDGSYRVGDARMSSSELIKRYAAMTEEYPIWSIEDGLAEDDEDGWRLLTKELGDRVQLVGDDVFATNPAIIRLAIEHGIGNAALIKPNQIGTVTETLQAISLCQTRGYAQMISHRSGETHDDFIADLAVASGCGQLKSGAPARGERIAKYNRLLEIAAYRPHLPFGLPEGARRTGGI